MDYEDLLQMLGAMVDGQQSEDWAMHWRMLFSVNLPLYASVRCAIPPQHTLAHPTPARR